MRQTCVSFGLPGWLVAIFLIGMSVLSACSSSNGDKSPASDESGAAPTKPGDLSAVVHSSHAAELLWEPSTDDGWVIGYDIYRNGGLIEQRLDSNSYFETRLEPATSYAYRVVAVDDQGNESLPAETQLTTFNESLLSSISADNHVELLKYVFDIFTGEAYGADMLGLPDYPDPAYDDSSATGDSVVETKTCINGGTATFTPFYNQAIPGGSVVAGWAFEFDDCQLDSNVYDGMVDRKNVDNGVAIELISTGLTIDSQSGSTSFSGIVNYNPSGSRAGFTRFYSVDNVNYSVTNTVEPFELMDATFDMTVTPNGIGLAGEFAVSSEATNGQLLDVQASLSYNIFDCGDHDCGDSTGQDDPEFFQDGVLQVSAANGDSLLLDTATGDHATLNIEITSDGTTETIMQSWSIWRESINFNWDLLN